jgi:hypothetical protein
MKTKTTIATLDLPKKDLAWAHDLTGMAMEMVHQLESLSRMMGGISPKAGEDPQVEAKDIGFTMGLFAENLGRIGDLLDDVTVVMEEVDPSIHTAVNE